MSTAAKLLSPLFYGDIGLFPCMSPTAWLSFETLRSQDSSDPRQFGTKKNYGTGAEMPRHYFSTEL